MSGEIIQDDMPISFEQASKNEYSEKARKVRQKLLEATDSKTVTARTRCLCFQPKDLIQVTPD